MRRPSYIHFFYEKRFPYPHICPIILGRGKLGSYNGVSGACGFASSQSRKVSCKFIIKGTTASNIYFCSFEISRLN